jgi:mono/diheme cytochrome c family protein
MSGIHPRRARMLVTAAGFVAGAGAAAFAQAATETARGELLYATHCIACHSTQVHWREQKLARDWTTLRQQVRRWAGNAGLGWSDEEIADVARYLNATYYRFDVTTLTGPVAPEFPRRTARAD